ncbi:DUF6597 domain-containing transcriptional factor [Mucilaginibacter sp.]|uniref:DUF6597 domain-containing transcriptional factor n=1 Tax=Mucilaginibacter sp. TaxID=1882438 RepID=UPI0035BC1A14
MHYYEYQPGKLLRDYVQCYFTCETNEVVTIHDQVFASGSIEIMFNLGAESPQTIINSTRVTQPAVQLWGQTIQPLSFTTIGRHKMLGIRFFGHTAAYFFDEPIANFNDHVIDLKDVAGQAVRILYDQLQSSGSLVDRITLLEHYLLAQLARHGKSSKLKLMCSVVQALQRDDFFENINSVARDHGLSSRYLQKLFLAYSGLSPKLFVKIYRFRKSIEMVAGNDLSLTAIAYQCGYYDQSHFIKDFKYFTRIMPSHFCPESSTDLAVPLNY